MDKQLILDTPVTVGIAIDSFVRRWWRTHRESLGLQVSFGEIMARLQLPLTTQMETMVLMACRGEDVAGPTCRWLAQHAGLALALVQKGQLAVGLPDDPEKQRAVLWERLTELVACYRKHGTKRSPFDLLALTACLQEEVYDVIREWQIEEMVGGQADASLLTFGEALCQVLMAIAARCYLGMEELGGIGLIT